MTSSYQPEKRRHHRIIFKDPKKIAALISPIDEQEPPEDAAAASILNMSEGGIQMSVEKQSGTGLELGREIMLHCISGLPDLSELTEVPMQIVWVIENEFLDHILIGTAFRTLSEQQRQSLRAFVNASIAHEKEK